MKCYIVSYDLRNNREYASLYEGIKSYSNWAHITESNWAIVTDQTAVQVRDYLLTKIDSDDRLFVIKSGTEAAWQNTLCENEWLKENL